MASSTDFGFKISADNSDAIAKFKQLKDELVSLRDSIKNSISDVKIKITADASSIAHDVQQIKNTIKTQLGEVQVKVKVQADTASINAGAAHIKNQLRAAIGTVDIALNISANTSTIMADLASIRNQISAHLGRAEIKLLIDMPHLQAQIAQARALLASLITGGIQVNIDATATGLIGALNALRVAVDELRSRMGPGGGGGGGGGGPGGGGAGGLGGLRGTIAGVVAGYVGIETIGELTKMSDAAALLNARLADLTGTEQELVQTKQKLFDAAQRLQVGYQDMTSSVARMIPSLKELGRGTDDAVKLSEILMTTAKLSGASTEEAASSAQQFSQALGSGVLQGDELGSILENNQALARALAAALKLPDSDIKVTIGSLKQLGADGKITSKILADALLGSYDQIMAKADQLPTTFSGVWQRIKNITFKTVDEMNQIGVFDSALNGLNELFLRINELQANGTLKEWASGVKEVLDAAGNAMSDLFGIATDVITQITSLWTDLTQGIEDGTGVQITLFDLLKGAVNGVGLVFVLLRTGIQAAFALITYLIRESVLNVVDKLNKLQTSIETLKTNATFWLDALGISFRTFAQVAVDALTLNWAAVKTNWDKGLGELEKLAQDRTKRLAKIGQDAQTNQAAIDAGHTDNQTSLDKGLSSVTDGVSKWLGRVLDGSPAKNTAAPKKLDIGPVKRVNLGAGDGDDKAEKKAQRAREAAAKAEYENIKASFDYQMKLSDQAYESNKIGLEEYYKEKYKLITDSADAERAALEKLQSVTNDPAKKKSIDADIQKITTAQKEEYAKLDALKKKVDEDRKKSADQLNADLARAEGRSLDARKAEIQRKYDEAYRDIQNRFAGTLNAMDKATKDHQLEIIAKIKFEEDGKANADSIAKATQKIINKQQDQAATIGRARQDSGGWNKVALDKAENSSRSSAETDLKAQRDKLQALKDSGIADLDEQIRSINNAIDEMGVKIPTAFQELSLGFKQTALDAAQSGLGDFLMNLVDGSKSVGEAAKDMLRSFIRAIAQMAAQALAKIAIFALLNVLTGGASAGAGVASTAATIGTSAISTEKHHIGGVAGSSSTMSNIDASAFIGAPRYHAGGIAGLAPGEVPAILRKGEEVLTENDPRHVNNGGGGKGGATVVKVINVFTKEQAIEHMSSAEGEKAQLNMMERNASAIRSILNN